MSDKLKRVAKDGCPILELHSLQASETAMLSIEIPEFPPSRVLALKDTPDTALRCLEQTNLLQEMVAV